MAMFQQYRAANQFGSQYPQAPGPGTGSPVTLQTAGNANTPERPEGVPENYVYDPTEATWYDPNASTSGSANSGPSSGEGLASPPSGSSGPFSSLPIRADGKPFNQNIPGQTLKAISLNGPVDDGRTAGKVDTSGAIDALGAPQTVDLTEFQSIYDDVMGSIDKERTDTNTRYDEFGRKIEDMGNQRTGAFQRRAESANVQMGGRLGGVWAGALRQAGISGQALTNRDMLVNNQNKQAAMNRLFELSTQTQTGRAGVMANAASSNAQMAQAHAGAKSGILSGAASTDAASQNALDQYWLGVDKEDKDKADKLEQDAADLEESNRVRDQGLRDQTNQQWMQGAGEARGEAFKSALRQISGMGPAAVEQLRTALGDASVALGRPLTKQEALAIANNVKAALGI